LNDAGIQTVGPDDKGLDVCSVYQFVWVLYTVITIIYVSFRCGFNEKDDTVCSLDTTTISHVVAYESCTVTITYFEKHNVDTTTVKQTYWKYKNTWTPKSQINNFK
jgi:hypothetical protein